MLHGSSIRTRIALLVFLLLLAAAALGAFSVSVVRSVRERLDEVHEHGVLPLAGLITVTDTAHRVRHRVVRATAVAAAGKKEEVVALTRQVADLDRELDKLIAAEDARGAHLVEVRQVERTLGVYREVRDRVLAAASEGDAAHAAELAAGPGWARFDDFRAAVEALANAARKSEQDELARADQAFRELVRLAGVVTVLGLALLAFVVRYIVRSITVPLDELERGFGDAVRSGALGVRLTVRGDDEVARVASAANALLSQLDGLTRQVHEVMGEASRGGLKARITFQGAGELDGIRVAVNAFLDKLVFTFDDLSKVVRAVAVGTTQASSAIGQVSDGASHQLKALQQVSIALQQSSSAIATVSAAAHQSSENVREATQLVSAGAVEVDHIVESVKAMSDHAREVGRVTEVISQIAAQTNMLSLNAAIEAARAGEFGKGFAVVAEQVGRLAVNAGKSVENISELVDRSTAETNRGVERTRAVSLAFESTATRVKVAEKSAIEIASAIEQQATAVAETNVSVVELRRIGEGNATAAEEISVTVVDLASLAQRARASLEAFTW